MTRSTIQRNRGFTLIELITVIAIIAVLFSFAIPAISNTLRANNLTTASNNMVSDLAAAQQIAMKENTSIQVRFWQYDDPSLAGNERAFRGYQFFRRAGSDPNKRNFDSSVGGSGAPGMEQVSPLKKLPESIVISSNQLFSSLVREDLTGGIQSGNLPWGRAATIDASYISFDFESNGGTNLPTTQNQQYYITLFDGVKDVGGELPPNFACIQIDPFNGSVRLIRP